MYHVAKVVNVLITAKCFYGVFFIKKIWMYLLLHCVLIKMRWIYGMVANCKIKNRYRVGIGSVEYSHTLKWGREQTIALLSRFNIKRRAKQTSQRTSHCKAAAVRSILRISTLRLTHDSKVYVKIFQLFLTSTADVADDFERLCGSGGENELVSG